MCAAVSEDQRLNGMTASGCRIRLVRSSKAGDLAKQPNFVNTSSQSKTWGKNLSPFIAGPVNLYDGTSFVSFRCGCASKDLFSDSVHTILKTAITGHVSQCVENAWQYCKVYAQMADENGEPTAEYWEWAQEGWANPKAKRFPLGKGGKPSYSLWAGKHLGYMDARLTIYCSLYAQAMKDNPWFEKLKQMTLDNTELILSDPDASDFTAAGKNLKEALFDTSKPLSHSVVLAMLLSEVPVWEEFLTPSDESPESKAS